MTFRDHVVWVTGASSGIGEAVAKEMARRGARLVLTARRVPELRRVASECMNPRDHLIYPLDLTKPPSYEAVVDEVRANIGEIDCFVHASGLSQRGRVEHTKMSVDRQLMEVNYFAAVGLTKALLPAMLERRQGHFVPISSVAGKLGTPQRSAYCASKHALHGFYEAVRAEVHDHGLRVTIVCPGYVRTSLSLNALTATGTPYRAMDPTTNKGMSPAECATRIALGIEREEEEVLIGGFETLVVPLKRWAPGVASRVVRGANQMSSLRDEPT